ncbi:heavy metal translocating P-type ATPase [Cesiribacter andamanensis]|uniref:Putative copper-importing P-type ATPase A n=1 Tax=Cesiribacter andamanensis AMV16 TaxID=1279009 RepID=M7P1B7_9BACT|nr:heavy metal translocating P-type ATPase metal-binding domain-containing protein [Cesiribacter andamanensis]EMR04404.1 putative copper-importing P-type ATPase A [Cesiribacter andamanensis AMV16]
MPKKLEKDLLVEGLKLAVENKGATSCYHCGDKLPINPLMSFGHSFCCQGCQTVYELLHESGMEEFYSLPERSTSKGGEEKQEQWAYLEHEEVRQKLLSFTDGSISKATFYLPAIHCSSCIWLLENLHKLSPGIRSSVVNFGKKEVSITWAEGELPLRALVELLSRLGYAPDISLESVKGQKKKRDWSFYLKLGIAGFCFGNIMMLSLPEYLDGKGLVDPEYQQFFSWLNMLLALPVVFYSATEFYTSAWRGLRYKYISLDMTITLGIFTIWGRSMWEILTVTGAGYMDSLCGLIFFLLIGKWYQSKTYEALSFERDYNSYFPVAATRLKGGKEDTVLLKDLEPGDRILIRNQELIPADAILMKGEGKVDYAFVTGESAPQSRQSGDLLYAGGRQTGGTLEVEIKKKVESSYLTQLWNQEVFQKGNTHKLSALVQGLSSRFTWFILLLSLATAAYWYWANPAEIWNTVTAVLIVACPCALALVIPFAFGNTIRVLGRWGLYLKNAEAVEDLALTDTLVFDKTGTITHKKGAGLAFVGELDEAAQSAIRSLTRTSTHPLSQRIYQKLGDAVPLCPVQAYAEEAGRGISGWVGDEEYKLGSASFVGLPKEEGSRATRVYISRNGQPLGHYEFQSQYREGLDVLLGRLRKQGYELHLLSGDNDRERAVLQNSFDALHFNQQPMDKLQYIRRLKAQGKKVMMVGDGLNDAGALKESQLGISVSDDVYHFSPACDAILDAKRFEKILTGMQLAKSSMRIINIAFILSFLYNIIGLSFAVTANLAPIVCAILMPLSSVTIVGFVTAAVLWKGSRLEKD